MTLAGKSFAKDADVKQSVTFCIQTLDTDLLHGQKKSLGATVGQMLKR